MKHFISIMQLESRELTMQETAMNSQHEASKKSATNPTSSMLAHSRYMLDRTTWNSRSCYFPKQVLPGFPINAFPQRPAALQTTHRKATTCNGAEHNGTVPCNLSDENNIKCFNAAWM